MDRESSNNAADDASLGATAKVVYDDTDYDGSSNVEHTRAWICIQIVNKLMFVCAPHFEDGHIMTLVVNGKVFVNLKTAFNGSLLDLIAGYI